MNSENLMITNKLAKEFDSAGWQWQDKAGQVFKLEDLSRDDLLQVACNCMQALEDAESACVAQQAIFSAWRTGRKVPA